MPIFSPWMMLMETPCDQPTPARLPATAGASKTNEAHRLERGKLRKSKESWGTGALDWA
jgi:hypothetical protein